MAFLRQFEVDKLTAEAFFLYLSEGVSGRISRFSTRSTTIVTYLQLSTARSQLLICLCNSLA